MPHPVDPAAGAAPPDLASWDDLRALLAVARLGSLNKAARSLGESQPTTARRIGRLERALGAALVRRGVNAVALTEAGRAVAAAAGPMQPAAEAALLAAARWRAAPDAPLRLTTTTSVALFLSAHLPALRAAAAPRDILLIPSRRGFDIAGGEADIGLRMRAPPREAGLLTRKVGEFVFTIYARRDAPDGPMLMPPDRDATSRQLALARRELAARPAGPQIDEMHLRVQAVKAGVGVGSLPCFIGDADPELTRVRRGADFEVHDDVYLVRTPASRDDPRVEALTQALVRLFRTHRPLLAGEGVTRRRARPAERPWPARRSP